MGRNEFESHPGNGCDYYFHKYPILFGYIGISVSRELYSPVLK